MIIEQFKKLFGKRKEQVSHDDPPGRTFKRILTGDYFGLQDPHADEAAHQAAKEEKIALIAKMDMKPKFVRYALKKKAFDEKSPHITAAHVVFQNEVFDEKWHMVHVTEISFIVPKEEFETFETMAGVRLTEDFRDLTEYDGKSHYNGKERRKERRKAPFSDIDA